MKKKLVIGCIGIVFMLISITMVSAINNKKLQQKESPLFNIRVQNTLQEKKQVLKEKMNNFFVNLLDSRLFLCVPLLEINNANSVYILSRGGACSVKCSLENEDIANQQTDSNYMPITVLMPTVCGIRCFKDRWFEE